MYRAQVWQTHTYTYARAHSILARADGGYRFD